MKETIKSFIFILTFSLIYSFDFGETIVNLTKVNGGTATLNISSQYNGTTSGSDLRISNLKIICEPGEKIYYLTCVSNIQLELLSSGTEFQCSLDKSTPTSSSCVLFGNPNILSTGDTFTPIDNLVPAKTSKFGKVEIELVSVEGKNTIIKLIPERTGDTTTTNLYIINLIMNNKALTCEAGKILKLEAHTGTNMECSISEEIDGNILCKLGGKPKIISVGDSFDEISVKTNSVKSSFGIVKVGLFAAKGTTITINFQSEYKGNIVVDISGLEINGTSVLDCPTTNLFLIKEGVQLECTIANGVNEDDLCILTSTNLKSNALPKLKINEDEKNITARNSKYGKVKISLKSVYDTRVGILIKTTFFAMTESNKFIIDGLKIHYDNSDYILKCLLNEKINFIEEGTDFTCTTNKIIGGKKCQLSGVAIFNSEGDTFSDISISNNTIYSSFGKITINLVSVVGKNVGISLKSEITGKTSSSVASIDNLKLNGKELTCLIGVNINFSDRPYFICTLNKTMNGNILSTLSGDNTKIIESEDSNDVFGDVVVSSSSVLSSFGDLEISLVSVVGEITTINLKSEYIGELTSLSISNIYLNNIFITCNSGKKLILTDEEGNSDADIQCDFSDYYSQESNTSCTLLGTPNYSPKLFTSVFIGSNNTVTSGIRNFGETILYLNSIKGTTVFIAINPSINGKVRPIISNLTLQCGTETYEVKCDVADKKQLYKDTRTNIKCYIERTINEDIECRLNKENVTITSDTEDIFGNIVISTDSINIKPEKPDYGDTEIKLTSIVGTQVNINIMVSSTTVISNVSPIIHGLYLGSSELYCASTQALAFTNNMAQMSCTSPSSITCTDCQLSGTPTIVTSERETATFGTTTLKQSIVQKTSSTLGDVSIKLKQVIGNEVYIGVYTTNSAKSSQKVDINNLYVDGQRLFCSDDILFTSGETQMKCHVEESIPYNKEVILTGTPSIKIYSNEESVNVVQITETNIGIISKSYSALCFELISVKENIAIISIIANDLQFKTSFSNFIVNGLAINNVPFEIELSSIYLSNNTNKIKVKLNETIPRDTPCTLNGVETARIIADNATFGPFTSLSNTQINSTSFKFGSGKISILYVQGYTVILKIFSTKTDYTKNTEINGLYINDNIPIICKIKDDIEFNENGVDVECKLSTPIDEGITCSLSFKEDTDDNFEIIEIVNPKSVISQYKYFGDVIIGLKEVSGKNVKIFVKTGIQNITTTNNVRINNLFVNNNEIICKFNENINFVSEGNELNCILDSLANEETYTLSGKNIEIISLADRFGQIVIDEKSKAVRASPRDIEGLTISLSSIAGDKASIKLSTSYELYTYLKISNLKIKARNSNNIYILDCPNTYIDLKKEIFFYDIIICSLSNKFVSYIYFSLVDNKDEIIIDSYDNFQDIQIKTNEVITTKFGDIFINYVDSSIALNISSLYQGETNSNINIYNIMLNSSLILDCGTLESIEINPKGTIVYCTLKEVKGAEGVNNQPPFILPNSAENTFGNIILEKKSNNNLKSANCYAFYNKTSCELNKNCFFAKETYGYCNYRNNYMIDSSKETESRDCALYLNQGDCINDDKCVWNYEYKYQCKNKQIENCKYLDKLDSNKCEECDSGYQLSNDGTKCQIYHCIEYTDIGKCNSFSNCQYYYSSFYYCSNKEQTDEESNCHLYLTQNSCISQEKCSWKLHYNNGCREKYIDFCIKLKESNESLCEKCEEGYYLSSENKCTKINSITYETKKVCENIDNEEQCSNQYYCQFSSRAYCSGNENCRLILNKDLCEERYSCQWNNDYISKCKVRYIQNCLIISSEDYNICSKCEDGYYLYNGGTICRKSEENNYQYCFEYGGEEKRCLNNNKCEFSNRNYCESIYNDYIQNIKCSDYLNQTYCENNGNCYWNTDNFKSCKIKVVEHCSKLDSEESSLCNECESGYTLNENSTECSKNSEDRFIKVSLIALSLILLLF